MALCGWARVTRREALARLLGFTRIATWFALAFHSRYWIWRDCFNEEGRCSDSEAGVMVEQAGLIGGGLFLIFAALALRALVKLRRP